MTDDHTPTSEQLPEYFETRAIHAGQEPDPATGAVMPAIQLSTTFEQDAPGKDRGYEYARTGNPTRSVLEENIATLEGGEFGRAFASGMASINTVLNLLESGDHVVAGDDIYGGTHRLFRQVYEDYDLSFSFVDTTDLDAVADAVGPDTELVWVETPTNPLLQVTDIAALAEIAHDRRRTLCCRQHLRNAVPPAPARTRGRPGLARADEVPRRSLRRGRRRARHRRPRP